MSKHLSINWFVTKFIRRCPKEIEIPFDPAIPLLGIYPKDYKSFYNESPSTGWLFRNQPKCPSMIDWIGKMWHIYTIEYYASVKKDEFVSFVGTWMNLDNIILGKLTQEQKMKSRIFSLIGGWWRMRTHGHREGSTKHWGLLGGKGEGQRSGGAGKG